MPRPNNTQRTLPSNAAKPKKAAACQANASDAEADTTQSPAPPLAKVSKSQTVLDLLQGDGGATLEQLTGATGWLPHTTRAALTGLRKKDHDI